MSDDPAMQLEMRRRIVELVRRYAGLHLREIARQLDTSVALVEYHMPVLEEAGLVKIERGSRYQRVFPAGDKHLDLSKPDKRRLEVLRMRVPLQITLLLKERGPVRHKDLVEGVGLGKSTVTFNVKKLVKAGIVEKRDDGAFALADPAATERLLLEHRPTPDLRQEFADLWLSFYER